MAILYRDCPECGEKDSIEIRVFRWIEGYPPDTWEEVWFGIEHQYCDCKLTEDQRNTLLDAVGEKIAS